MAAVIDTMEAKSSFVEASHGFNLTNEVVSKLMGSVVESGLGSMEDANLIIIPTLGSRSKLPAPIVFLSQAYLLAEEHRLQRRFRAAEEVLRWSYDIALEAHDTDQNQSVIEHAVLELAELYRFALRADKIPSQTNPPQGFYSNGLEKLKDMRDHLNLAPITELVNRYTEIFGTDHLPGYPGKYSSESKICLDTAETGNRVHCLWILTEIGFKGQVDLDPGGYIRGNGNRSILSWAAQWGWWEVARASLELGCKVDLHDDKGWTPLTYAAYYGYAEIIRLLLRYGANPEVQDGKQRTPLSYASEQAWTSAVQVLLEDGVVDSNVKDQRGYTPLHCAAEGGSCEVVDLLVEKGARLDERGQFGPEGSPPIVIAWGCGNPDVAEHLHNLGARFNFQKSGEALWQEIIHEGQLRSAVCSISVMNRESEPGSSAEASAVQLFHHIDYDLGLFSAEDIVGEQQAPGLNIIEVLEEGTTGATHDTLVRYLQGEVEATLQVVGACPQVLTVTDVKNCENCFNLTKDLMSYLNIGLTENILEATAKCERKGSADLFCLFLEQSKSNGPISPDLVKMAVASGTFAEDKLKHLIKVRQGDVPVTSEVLEAAIGSNSMVRMMDIFLELKGELLEEYQIG
ncbi:hypothetical protein CSPX01_11069 [Colletotrichum filicis]|nr:hypothetical protein CSPX01_11069 [Colletotrichum filicis]